MAFQIKQLARLIIQESRLSWFYRPMYIAIIMYLTDGIDVYVCIYTYRAWNKDWKVLRHMSSQDEICSDIYQKWSDISRN